MQLNNVGCEDAGGQLSEITRQSAVKQLALLREGKISPLELAEEHIRAIERMNPRLNAIVDFDADRVREQARALTSERMAPSAPRRPLFGLPVTVKSSIATAGLRCEIGSLLRKGEVAREDAVVVARLRRAGANILGTTNCPEFLMAYETDNRLYGQTKNPWDLEYTPGGSSGGEAAAIASGMSAAGLGSDSGGSVRTPAHFTGICALKPTPRAHPGRRSSAAVRRAIFHPGGHRSHGAHNGRHQPVVPCACGPRHDRSHKRANRRADDGRK